MRLFLFPPLLKTILQEIKKLRTIIVSPIINLGVPFLSFSNTLIFRKSNPLFAKNISIQAIKLHITPAAEIVRRNNEVSFIDFIIGRKAKNIIIGVIVYKLSLKITIAGSPFPCAAISPENHITILSIIVPL